MLPAGLPAVCPGRMARRAICLRAVICFADGAAPWPPFSPARCAPSRTVWWQFVLELRQEEPLDLLDTLLAVLRVAPKHLLDRYCRADAFRTPRGPRIFIRLVGPSYDPDWVEAAERTTARGLLLNYTLTTFLNVKY